MKRNRKRISKIALYNKTKLRLPGLDQAKAAVLNTLRTTESRRDYEQTVDEFIEWYCSESRLSFNKMVVIRYRVHPDSSYAENPFRASLELFL